jgi:hypothetical protein
MNLVELDHALRKLRLSGMADVLEARLRQAQSEKHTNWSRWSGSLCGTAGSNSDGEREMQLLRPARSGYPWNEDAPRPRAGRAPRDARLHQTAATASLT